MAAKEDRRVEVHINKAARKVDLAILRMPGSTVIADINFTVEQAIQHIKHLQTAVDMIIGQTAGGIIVPEGVNVTKQ